MRSPLLASRVERFGEGLEAAASLDNPERLEQALAADVARLRQRLRERVDGREATRCSSPRRSWSPPSGPGSATRTARAARESNPHWCATSANGRRATPFGLFAGARWVASRVPRGSSSARGTQPAPRPPRPGLPGPLLSTLEQDPALRAELTFRPNSSLYRAAGQLRFVETRVDGRKRAHQLTAVEESEHLRIAIQRARDGATPAELTAVVAANGVSREHAEHYVEELIDSQVLVPELAIPITGHEPLDLLAKELSAHGASADIGRRLVQARDALDRSTRGDRGPTLAFRAVADALGDLPAEGVARAPVSGRHAQADASRDPRHRRTRRAGRGIEASTASHSDRLLGAVDVPGALVERFGQREVPLVEALDDDAGVGFPGTRSHRCFTLREGLTLPAGEDADPWGKRQRLLLRKLKEAAAAGAESISLDRGDLDVLAVDEPQPLPDALAVRAVLAAASEEALDAGEFQLLLREGVGPSGARLLGRFAHGTPSCSERSADLAPRRRCSRMPSSPRSSTCRRGASETSPRARCCVHTRSVPRPLWRPARTADPRGRPHGLRHGAPSVSPLGEGIVLRSRRLGRLVVPRLTTAHAFGYRSVPLYRFLCLLQGQDRRKDAWSWGPLAAAPFLPRVEAGRLVLSPAQWGWPRTSWASCSNPAGRGASWRPRSSVSGVTAASRGAPGLRQGSSGRLRKRPQCGRPDRSRDARRRGSSSDGPIPRCSARSGRAASCTSWSCRSCARSRLVWPRPARPTAFERAEVDARPLARTHAGTSGSTRSSMRERCGRQDPAERRCSACQRCHAVGSRGLWFLIRYADPNEPGGCASTARRRRCARTSSRGSRPP